MIFQMAGTSAYDKNEVQVYIIAEKGESIRIASISPKAYPTIF